MRVVFPNIRKQEISDKVLLPLSAELAENKNNSQQFLIRGRKIDDIYIYGKMKTNELTRYKIHYIKEYIVHIKFA